MEQTVEKLAEDINSKIEGFKSDLAKAVKAEDLKSVEDQLNKFVEKHKDFDSGKMTKEITDIGEQLNLLKDKMIGGGESVSFKEKVYKAISERKDEIKAAYKNKGTVQFEITTKDPELVTTDNAAPAGTVPDYAHQQFAPATNVNIRESSILNRVTTLNTSLAAYPYTETVPKDGDFSFVAEGAKKPQVDLKVETRYATPVKAAGWIHLTEESVEDIVGLQSIAADFLLKKHNRVKAKGILNGDGISPNPKGATAYGRAFVAGDMAGQVSDPNIMDVINAGVTDIFTTHNYEDETPYMANISMLHPVDFFLNFVSAKTQEGTPLYPTAGLFNMVVIGGVLIMPDEDIEKGHIFIADLSKYNVTNYKPYRVEIGWINDDFIKNQFVMLGESRFHAFVKKLDEQAFIYDEIANIKNALEGTPSV